MCNTLTMCTANLAIFQTKQHEVKVEISAGKVIKQLVLLVFLSFKKPKCDSLATFSLDPIRGGKGEASKNSL